VVEENRARNGRDHRDAIAGEHPVVDLREQPVS
jgi:hypothetical protein